MRTVKKRAHLPNIACCLCGQDGGADLSITCMITRSKRELPRRATYIVYGYGFSYKDALANSSLSNLYKRRSELSQNFFSKLLINIEDKLLALLPFNVSQPPVTSRKDRTLTYYYLIVKQTDSIALLLTQCSPL